MKLQTNHSSKTTRQIKRALLELIDEKKELEEITVSELVERADVNRGTFYNHYKNLIDLVHSMQQEFLNDMEKIKYDHSSVEDLHRNIDITLQWIFELDVDYTRVLGSNDGVNFILSICSLLKDKACRAFADFGAAVNEYLISLTYSYISGIVSLYAASQRQEFTCSNDDLQKIAHQVFEQSFAKTGLLDKR